MKTPQIEVLDEKLVARTAAILGPASAAQLALDNAAARRSRGEEVVLAKHGSMIVVVPTAALLNH